MATIRPAVIALAAVLGIQGCVPLVVGGAAAGTALVHDRRSAGTVLADQNIELSIRQRIVEDEAFQGSHINVTSYNNIVLLTGEVPTREVGRLAGRIARDTGKVRQVHNELVITEPSSLPARGNDSLITAGVKSMLLAVDQPGFDPTRVKVITARNVVYLMGLVTEAEADAVSDRARRVSGVSKVVRLFEIIQ
jgi:osmotically-inducible protein OsmY